MNQKSPKDPKSILILTMKLLQTYFWKRLPVGALIWLAPNWLISPNRATHLKSPKKYEEEIIFDWSDFSSFHTGAVTSTAELWRQILTWRPIGGCHKRSKPSCFMSDFTDLRRYRSSAKHHEHPRHFSLSGTVDFKQNGVRRKSLIFIVCCGDGVSFFWWPRSSQGQVKVKSRSSQGQVKVKSRSSQGQGQSSGSRLKASEALFEIWLTFGQFWIWSMFNVGVCNMI